MNGLESALIGVVAQIADGSLGEVGARLWGSLAALIRSARGKERGGELVAAEDSLPAEDSVREIAELLAGHARNDERFKQEVIAWLAQAREAGVRVDVSNTVSGDVTGNVFQAGEIGSIRID